MEIGSGPFGGLRHRELDSRSFFGVGVVEIGSGPFGGLRHHDNGESDEVEIGSGPFGGLRQRMENPAS